ncbi:MAG: pyridoxal-phosphate dependent enzyme [Veillonella parvula]|nr:pyridoxal-phosphate dependent enzyme [Veillonella parvula]
MYKLYDFMEARERLSTITVKTKLLHSDVFSDECGNDVYIKPENLQITGSFKVRGAYNKIAKLTEEEKARGVIAASAGNHAQGVALAAKRLGIKATIVMPKHTPLIKVNATKQYGADVVLFGEIYDEAYQKAMELQKEHGYVFVHPFNDEDVIEGQGTIALEVLDELPDADILLVPVGGGGIVSGIAAAAKLKNPRVKIIGVEPEGAASALAALKADHPVPLDEVATIADGTAVRQIGETTLEYIKQYVDEIITVSDYELMEAFLLLVEKHKLVAENSGILPLAGLKKLFSVNLPDKPGQLVAVSQMLADADANVIKLDHNQFKNLDRFHEVELQVTVETNGEEHIQHIIDTFKHNGYIIKRLNSSEILSE